MSESGLWYFPAKEVCIYLHRWFKSNSDRYMYKIVLINNIEKYKNKIVSLYEVWGLYCEEIDMIKWFEK